MACRVYILMLSSFFGAGSLFSQPLGSWQDHLPYMQAKVVRATDDLVICATPFALFTIDLKDQSIERLSKINGLSEVGIKAMERDVPTNKTIVAYHNSKIDIITADGIVRLHQINQSNISADKRISNIFLFKEKAYVATAFGIVVVDLQKNEIKESYIIGRGGRQAMVYQVTANDQFFYAATPEGLLRAPLSGANLADYRSWELVNTGLWVKAIDAVAVLGTSIIARKGDSLFINIADTWKFFYTTNLHISGMNVSAGKLVISEYNEANAQVVILLENGSIEKIYAQPGLIVSPVDAILKNNEIWIADSMSGLLQSSGTSFKSFRPNSPYSMATGDMVFHEGNLWVASGNKAGNFENSFSKNGFFRYHQGVWENYLPGNLGAVDSLYDLVTLAVSPNDHSAWVGSLGGGLLRFSGKENPQIFKQASGLSASLFHPGQYRVSGLAFDADQHLWISNYGAAEGLVVKKSDGSYRKFRPPFALAGNALSQIVIDDFNRKWIVAPEGNGLVVFDHGVSIDNPGDDRWKFFRSGKGNGNLPSNNVLSIAKDKTGFIWVGTAKGIGIIQCTGEVFSGSSCDAILPIVQQDNFAGYLFGNEEVQAIAVNGADQKWIGTKHGAWLVSSNGEKTLQHFTEENSPLAGNDVRKISIDPNTGDVFFATSNGICSFRGDAIEGNNVNGQLIIFPNPVPPGYNGSIAIRGVVNNAIVKITEMDGRLVFQARATGGQAIWNGRDYRGRQVASGVYLVFISDNSRKEKMSGKIVFISR